MTTESNKNEIYRILNESGNVAFKQTGTNEFELYALQSYERDVVINKLRASGCLFYCDTLFNKPHIANRITPCNIIEVP